MPPESGMSFILVQHLDPKHETLMPELLTKHTKMPVLRAANGMQVERNHIYVVSPKTMFGFRGCAFQIGKELELSNRNLIDDVFRALAEDQQEGVVGIVLSGNGSDGTVGLRAIKDHGGLTLAQHPDTAKFDSMPRSAISSGAVDFVLTIEEMAQHILRYAEHLRAMSDRQDSAAFHQQTEQLLPEIMAILRKQTGHDFSRYKQSTLIRRIQRRMQVGHLSSAAKYVDLLKSDPREGDALFKDLLISVTEFFRDPESFAALEMKVIPQLFEGKDHNSHIRVWVPGCASGEEAYTIAILLAEHATKLRKKPVIQIFATDLDSDALAIARKARYPEEIAEQLTPDRLKRYFKRVGAEYEVVTEIRELCIFSPHNLIKDPPFSRLDLLSCRNVMIYLEADLQKKLLPIFHYALNASGFLFLGPAENIASRSDHFRVIDSKHRVFQRKPTLLHSPLQLPSLGAGFVTKFQSASIPAAPLQKDQGLARLIERLILEEYALPSVIINDQGDVLYFSGATGKYLDPPVGVPSNKLISMARKNLRLELRTALHRAFTTRKEVVRRDLKLKLARGVQRIDLIVRPLSELGVETELYIVLFRELIPSTSSGRPPVEEFPANEHPVIKQLENELRTTKEDLQITIEELETSNEELKSANEELLSMNEELQSANEELQTSKEEVQSANEELNRKIEEAENAANELRLAAEDRARLAAIVENSDDAIIGKTLEGIVTSWNPAAERIFEFTAAEMIGQSITRVIPPDRQEEEGFILSRLRRGERIATYETERVTKNGRRVYISLTASPILDGEGNIIGAAKIARDVTDRKLADEARFRLAAVVESSDDAIITKTLDGIITSWNNAAERMYGYTANEVIGQPVTILIPADRADEEPAILQRLRHGDKIDHYETVRRRKDGSLIDVSLTVSPIKDRVGRIIGASKVARDITPRKHAEEVKFRLAAVVESSDDAIVTKNLDGMITSWNRGAERIFGYAASEAVGKHITLIFPPDRFHEEDNVISRIRRGERLEHFETVRKAKDGHLIDISLTVSPIKDPLGKVIGASKIARDITAQKRAERDLRELADRLQLAMAAGDLGDWIWEISTDIVTLSGHAAKVFGFPRETRLTWTELRELIHPDDRERARLAVEKAMLQRSQYSIEYRVKQPSGAERWVAAKGRGNYSTDGAPLGMTGLLQDITERKSTEQQLENAREELRQHASALEQQVAARTASLQEAISQLEEFSYSVSHDLRAPIRAISGYQQALEKDFGQLLPDEGRAYLAKIARSATRMERLVADVLTVSRISRADLNLHPISLNNFISEIIDSDPSMQAPAARIRIEAPHSVVADEASLAQAIANLLSNAVKFVGERQRPDVLVRSELRGANVRLWIEDQGIGIQPHHRPKLFGMFQRLPSKLKYEGTGIGLAIVRKAVERMGGTVGMEPNEPQGSRFWLELKRAE
jgi:two-component system, chemotaxis family, CheB/CheR fusion protein